MKNLFLLLFAMTFASGTLIGQDASKIIKSATKNISKYSSDVIANSNDILNSMAEIKKAMKKEEVKSDIKALISVGEAFNKLADAEFKSKTLDVTGQYKIIAPNAAYDAYKAFEAAAKIDDNKKDIFYGLTDSENLLNNFAIFAYQEQDYANSFKNFAASIDAHDLLKSMGKESRLQEGDLLKDQYFFASVSAYYNEDYDAAKPYLMKLYNDQATDAFIYDALYNITIESDEAKAMQYLEKGRELNPDDTGLLFTEINHYLKKGELNILIDKLKMAIEKEPDNISVYNTLGSVYDQLQQKAYQEGDVEKANEYFDNAYSYYSQVTTKDPDNFDATYSMGALYYNKAASYVEKLNELAADLTPAGMKAYDKTKSEMDGLFRQALPYFEKADSINGQDRNTLIALKEIYARLNNLEKSESYKMRLEEIGITNQ